MTTATPAFTKEIRYDRFTKSYSATVDGNLIGFFSTHHEAEVAADEHVFNLLSDGLHIPATALDGQCGDCGAALDSMGLCGCRAEKTINPPHPVIHLGGVIHCLCGKPALIIEPTGTFCGACHEAQDLWRLWKDDSPEFVAELRRQSCRLNEMAERLCVYLNAKNGSTLGVDSILAMWRNLLDDGSPPEPRYYVVAPRVQIAA